MALQPRAPDGSVILDIQFVVTNHYWVTATASAAFTVTSGDLFVGNGTLEDVELRGGSSTTATAHLLIDHSAVLQLGAEFLSYADVKVEVSGTVEAMVIGTQFSGVLEQSKTVKRPRDVGGGSHGAPTSSGGSSGSGDTDGSSSDGCSVQKDEWTGLPLLQQLIRMGYITASLDVLEICDVSLHQPDTALSVAGAPTTLGVTLGGLYTNPDNFEGTISFAVRAFHYEAGVKREEVGQVEMQSVTLVEPLTGST